MSAEPDEGYRQRARNFAIDALTAEVASAFADEGIGTVVLKGPVLARWLYPDEVRPYVDSDLIVAPGNRACAVGVLERLGFAEHCPWMPTPLSLDPGGTAFNRPWRWHGGSSLSAAGARRRPGRDLGSSRCER